MNHIRLQQTLPQAFARRDAITSQIWHQDIIFSKGKRYLIEAASGTGKSSLCSYIYGYRRDYQGRYTKTLAQYSFSGTSYFPRTDCT